ncbi:MAG: hypothetical protein K2Q20_08765, partial [Phycisphaerales bacterium]|nr:hypothetical protein [Phycisphaerales bacterium]
PKPQVDEQGNPVVGPDGQPVMQKPPTDWLGMIKANPSMLLVPAGILMALFGGDTGKILGALAIAGGGYGLWQRYENVKENGGTLYQDMHALERSTGQKLDMSPQGIAQFAQTDFAKQRYGDKLPSLVQGANDMQLAVNFGLGKYVQSGAQQVGNQAASFYAPAAAPVAQ